MKKKILQWYRNLVRAMQKNMIGVVAACGVLVVGGVAYWYVVPVLQKQMAPSEAMESTKHEQSQGVDGLEVRLTATEAKLQQLEKKIKEVEEDFDDQAVVIEKKMTRADEKVQEAQKLQARLSDAEKQIKTVQQKIASVGTLEEKVATLEKQETQEVKRLAAVNQIIREEVSGQVDSLRREVQDRDQSKKRKKVFQRFLDQLAADDD